MSTTKDDHGISSFDPVKLFDLERITATRFVGHGPGNSPNSHLYGGQIVAQALAAAQRTVGERHCHSLHTYFLAAGSSRAPLTFNVETLRDGGRFSIRRVRVGQDARFLCDITASFHAGGTDVEHQLVPMPLMPAPEELVEMSALPKGSRWTHVFVKRGMIPHAGDSFYLPRIIPFHRLNEIALLGDAVTADTLDAWGLINRLCDKESVQDTAMDLARRLADQPTRAIDLAKRHYRRSLEVDWNTMLREEMAGQALYATTADRNEILAAGLEGRKPVLTGD